MAKIVEPVNMEKLTKRLLRLVNKLEDRDSTIGELKAQVEAYETEEEEKKYQNAWRWRELRKFTLEENLKLPLPRLEMRWEGEGWSNRMATQFLVYRHFLKHIVAVPLGSTQQGGGYDNDDSERQKRTDLPFRDGAHMKSNMRTMGLRGFVVAMDGKTVREIKLNKDGKETLTDDNVPF